MIRRNPENPILTPKDVEPTAEGLKVVGLFNPGACILGEEVILLMRVAETCEAEPGWLKAPIMKIVNGRQALEIKSWKIEVPGTQRSADTRKFVAEGDMYLTSISHLRLARSRDGVHFTVGREPFLAALREDESFGVEDARITRIGDTYYILYTAVSDKGYGVNLAVTRDFEIVKRKGMVFAPKNKDACLFPEKVRGRYLALHRPMTTPFSKPCIWYAESPDLLHWGNHSCLLRPRGNAFEEVKIGAGPQPIKTKEGWLVLYHGCGKDEMYSLLLCLLDLKDPRKVLKRSAQPIMIPEAPWEKEGFFPNLVFSNGWVSFPDGRVLIYYGAADESICVAETTIDDLLASLDE